MGTRRLLTVTSTTRKQKPTVLGSQAYSICGERRESKYSHFCRLSCVRGFLKHFLKIYISYGTGTKKIPTFDSFRDASI